MGGAIGFAFRFAGGRVEGKGSVGRRGYGGGGATFGAGRTSGCGGGGGPYARSKVPNVVVGCRNNCRYGDICVTHCNRFNNSWNPGVCVKAACLLIDSTYILVVSDRGGMGKDVLGSKFTKMGEGAGGDRIARAGSAGRGGVSETVVRTKIGVSGTIVGTEASIDTSSGCVLPASLVLALDPRTCHSPDSVDFWLVLRVVGVWRFCSTSIGGRFGNSMRSGTFSSGTGLPRKKQFRVAKRARISAKIVSILAE